MDERKDIPTSLLGEALLETIRQAVREELHAAFKGNERGSNASTETAYLTVPEAARLSRLSTSTIRQAIRKRIVDVLRRGK